jgi:predicted transcriptional regulator
MSRVIGFNTKTVRRYDLRSLRLAIGKSQSDIARTAKMAQGDVSKLEDRADVKLSTLERYASALGGQIEVVVVVDGRRYRLDLEP